MCQHARLTTAQQKKKAFLRQRRQCYVLMLGNKLHCVTHCCDTSDAKRCRMNDSVVLAAFESTAPLDWREEAR